MDLRAQSAFLAALVAAVLAVAVALRATERRQALLFSLLAGNLALFHLADFLAAATSRELFTRLMLAAGATLPATGHRFFQAFLASHAVSSDPGAGSRVLARRLTRILWGGAAAGLVLAVTPLVRQPVVLGVGVAYVIGAFALVFHHVFQRRDTTRSRIERMRLTYVAVGGIIALGFAVLGFVPGLSGLFAAVGNLGIILYLYFLSQAILRHRLLDLNELLGKIVVLTGLALILTVVYGVILAAVGNRPPLLLFNLILASAIFLTLFPPLRGQAERRVMAWLFAERYELTQALERLRRALPGLIDPGTCAVRILDRLYDTNRVTHASMYLLSRGRHRLHPPRRPGARAPGVDRRGRAARGGPLRRGRAEGRAPGDGGAAPPGVADRPRGQGRRRRPRGPRRAPRRVAPPRAPRGGPGADARRGHRTAALRDPGGGPPQPPGRAGLRGLLHRGDRRHHPGRRARGHRGGEQPALPADEGARPPRRPRRDVRRPRPRDPQSRWAPSRPPPSTSSPRTSPATRASSWRSSSRRPTASTGWSASSSTTRGP